MSVLDRLHDVGVRRHLSPLTIECYQSWVRQFLWFCRDGGRWRHHRELRGGDVAAFVTHLARDRRRRRRRRTRRCAAVVFLYRRVVGDELGDDHLGPIAAERSTRPVRVPTVLRPGEVARVIACPAPGAVRRGMVELLYGAGRDGECCALRVRDVDFDRGQVVVRGQRG